MYDFYKAPACGDIYKCSENRNEIMEVSREYGQTIKIMLSFRLIRRIRFMHKPSLRRSQGYTSNMDL